MEQILVFLQQPWPWYVGGPMIALVMFLLLYFGESFGISANLRTLCTMCGGEKCSDFFCFEWKSQTWNLIFVLGTILGGYIAHHYLTPDQTIQLNPETIAELKSYGMENPGANYLPEGIFSWSALGTVRGWLVLVVGGFLVGFGSRYAGGCTSGHAISGLSNLQLPSLIASIGFFIGGFALNFFILPLILKLPF